MKIRASGPGGLIMLSALCALAGCEVDSFLDPSRTGYFEHTPTTIPVLDRIDVIELDRDPWGQTTAVTPQDLVPSDLSYKLAPGDVLTVQVFELYAPSQWHVSTRRIDAGGFFRLPEIGDVQAGGMTPQEFEDRVTRLLHEQVLEKPLVDVVVEELTGFGYTMYGAVGASGQYRLNRPDLRIMSAIATSGGVRPGTERVFVIRQIPLTEEVGGPFQRPEGGEGDDPAAPRTRPGIEDLIEDMPDDGVRPGAFAPQDEPPAVDIDDLGPSGAAGQDPPQVDVDELPRSDRPSPEDTFIYDEQRDEWVRVRAGGPRQPADAVAEAATMMLERVIEIPMEPLKRGDSSYNIVVRPDDRIYVEEPLSGVVYLEGEVLRPGVFNIPPNGRITLSRLIAAAGGFGQLAIPERIDLTRVVGKNREATIRLDLAAIRQRTAPDIYLKPDDHVIVGTNFWATPLAVARSGLRATYGFGFLLDRNFGNDVFGAPPINVR